MSALLYACGDPSGPGTPGTSIAPLAGDAQFATSGEYLAEPIQVVVTDAVTKEPREGITVTWQVIDGSATLSLATSVTNSRGIATSAIRVGTAPSVAHVRATADKLVGNPAIFTATAVLPPSITGVSPTAARAGDTITVTGANFGTNATSVAVLFDGIRGLILSVADDRIRVVVPACVATHNAVVQVAMGSVLSPPASLSTTGRTDGALRMARGEMRVFADPAALTCLRLPPDPAGASYMIIPQNAAQVYSIPMQFELAAFGVVSPIALRAGAGAGAGGDAAAAARAWIVTNTPRSRVQTARDYASDWEMKLRERERAMTVGRQPVTTTSAIRSGATQSGSSAQQISIPQVGEQRQFNTLNAKNETVKITAVVKAVSERAIFYQDIAAADALTTADYARLGALFDDPIYTTDTQAFGSVSDIDKNGHVIVVLTPQVNKLTARGTGFFIGGYFYACDLLSKDRCSATNSGEIFYSMVPDPSGNFGDPHSVGIVLKTVPPVIAHEFMHMINFSQRSTIDVLWLGEALAHTAEDLVGKALLARGDVAAAADFIDGNRANARLYLLNTGGTSLISDESPGTIELRGAGWLFLRYLRGLYGENTLLRDLTRSTTFGVQNITSHTNRSWASLIADFAVAIYADDAPDLAGAALDPRYTFVNANVRELIGTPYPLTIHPHAYSDFIVRGSLPSSAWQYEYVQTPALLSNASLNLVFSGKLGGGFGASAAGQMSVLRVK